MPRTTLFSTYRQGENPVTSSLMAVLQRIELGVVERLLQRVCEDQSLVLVQVENQPKGDGSVPDAAISAAFRYLFETKTARDAVNEHQLRAHAGILGRHPGLDERLIVLTPDLEEPAPIARLRDEECRVHWVGFGALAQAIEELLADTVDRISEHDGFLLRELLNLFEADGLLWIPDDTVVVAASIAFDFYENHSAYHCQSGRRFRAGVRRIGFYGRKRIRERIPLILYDEDPVLVSSDEAERRANGIGWDPVLAAIIRAMLAEEPSREGGSWHVFVLSDPQSPETLVLPGAIEHVGTTAWTQSQRYVRSERLAASRTTADLA